MIIQTKHLHGWPRVLRKNGEHLAKPIGCPGMTFFNKLVAAWSCLTGRAAAVRWYKK